MRGFLVSLGVHVAGIVGLVILPSFSASELPPPAAPPPPDRIYVPVVRRVELAAVKLPLAPRRTSAGGGGSLTGPVRSADPPSVISDAPLPSGIEEPQGEPGLPPGPPSLTGSELLSGPPVVAQSETRLVRADVDVRPPRKLAGSDPVYPPMAKVVGAQATVVLECTIGTDGRVSDVRVTRSHPLFDAAAVEAVLSWRYTPTLLSGVPVSVLMTVTVDFKLRR